LFLITAIEYCFVKLLSSTYLDNVYNFQACLLYNMHNKRPLGYARPIELHSLLRSCRVA